MKPEIRAETERMLLSEMMTPGCDLDEVLLAVASDDLLQRSRPVFGAIAALHDGGQPVDVMTVAEKLGDKLKQVGGVAYLAALSGGAATAASAPAHAAMIRNDARRLRIIAAATEIVRVGSDLNRFDKEVFFDWAEQVIFDAVEHRARRSLSDVRSLLRALCHDLQERHAARGSLGGLSTNFAALDKILDGLRQSDYILLAARPSMGKTALALDIVRHVVLRLGLPVDLFSLEMSDKQLMARLMGAEARFDLREIANAGPAVFDRIAAASEKLAAADGLLRIHDCPGASVQELRARLRRSARGAPSALVVVDYLQLMSVDAESHQIGITRISHGLKSIAREFNVPLLVLSQLNRAVESRGDKRPVLSDLRDSGSLEQDADVVAFLYRRDYYDTDCPPDEKGITEVLVRKQRNGPTDTARIVFRQENCRFESFTAWRGGA